MLYELTLRDDGPFFDNDAFYEGWNLFFKLNAVLGLSL
jgi:hypothetical protein